MISGIWISARPREVGARVLGKPKRSAPQRTSRPDCLISTRSIRWPGTWTRFRVPILGNISFSAISAQALTPRKAHRHPAPLPPRAQPPAGPYRGTPDLAQHVKQFVNIIYGSIAAGGDRGAVKQTARGRTEAETLSVKEGGASSSTGQTGARLTTNHRLDHGADRLGGATRDHRRHVDTGTLSETGSGKSRRIGQTGPSSLSRGMEHEAAREAKVSHTAHPASDAFGIVSAEHRDERAAAVE